jgi:hypothetical protein
MAVSPAGRRFRAIVCALVVLALVARALPGPRTIDDAFITFRYSRNLTDGLGFVYNPGVHTLGTTTPLWAMLMSATAVLTGGRDFPHYAIWWSALADALSAVLLFVLARRLIANDWVAALPGLLHALAPMSVTFAVGGMETSLVTLWMLAAFALYALAPPDEAPSRRRLREAAVGLLGAFAVLTRVDSLLWLAPLLGWQMLEALRQRRLPWATWAALAAVLLPFALWSWSTFGSPLPNSVTAKRFAYAVAPLDALAGLVRNYANLFSAYNLYGSVGTMVSGVIVLAGSLLAFSGSARRLPRLLPLLAYPWLYFVVFAIANPLMFRWYFAPPLPVLMLATFAGLWGLAAALLRERGRRALPALVGAAGALALASTLTAWTLAPDHGPARPAPKMAWHALELLYERMGRLLVERYGVTADTRVASADIGAIGYFSGATIVDTVGLVTPELTRYYPVDPALLADDQIYAIPPQLILDQQPAFLVTMEGFVREGLARDPAFLAQYALVEAFPFPYYGTEMQLWQRRG